jgi:ADP-ribose pyrophosphatase YjhB (NUDIX family)
MTGHHHEHTAPHEGGPGGHYCVNCGIPLEIRVVEDRELEACPRCDFVLWRDPKVVTLVVVEDGEGAVVLGRRAIEPGYGAWCLPGGFVNHDEHPAEAAVRECEEEISAVVEITELLGVYHIAKQHATSMVGLGYRARVHPGSQPAPGAEMLEVGSFAPDRLPEVAFPSHRDALRDWLAQRAARAGA